MCGIAGLVDPNTSAPAVRASVRRMAATFVHRGPDDEGFFAAAGVGLGMRPLGRAAGAMDKHQAGR